MDSPFVSADAQQNRRQITALVEPHGFLHYPGEFWHYKKGDALYHYMTQIGQTATNQVIPYDDVGSLLTPPDEMALHFKAALASLDAE